MNTTQQEPQTHYKLDQLADRWQVSVKWLRKQIYTNQLKAVKFGALVRIPVEEVYRFERSRNAA